MVGKSKINILKNTTENELHNEMKKCYDPNNMSIRLIAMNMINNGFSHTKTAKLIGVSYKTVHGWAKSCEKYGLDGLKTRYEGGRPSKLTLDEKIRLCVLIMSENLSISDVRGIIKKEFDKDYTLEGVSNLVKRLGFNYGTPRPIFDKTPEDKEEQLKKTI